MGVYSKLAYQHSVRHSVRHSILKAGLPFHVPEPNIGIQRGIPVPDTYRPIRSDPAGSLSVTSHQPIQRNERQRMILLSTLLPACLCVILILLGILAFVWYRKQDKSVSGRNGLNNRDVSNDVSAGRMSHFHMVTNPVAERVFKLCGRGSRPAEMPLAERSDQHEILSGNGTGNFNRGPMVSIHADTIDEQFSLANKPLLLPSEQIPLKPPEYNMGYTDSPMTINLPQFPTSIAQTPSSDLLDGRSVRQGPGSTMSEPLAPLNTPKPYYGIRPNPYRNLPPPIENRPGMPLPASQLPYAPYRPRQ